MGLDISSKSKYQYHFGYGGIHYVRFFAYKYCQGTKDFAGYMKMYDAADYDWGIIETYMRFPNLMYHSDAQGSYTLRGQIAPIGATDWYTGNSLELLRELEVIKRNLKKIAGDVRTDSFSALYLLVKDVVKNGDGKLQFR